MGEQNISKAVVQDRDELFDEYTIDSMQMDSPTGQKEQGYMNSNFEQQWGYFNKIPDLKVAILGKAIWTVGKGFTCDPSTQAIVDHMRGWGKDSFEDIIFNMEVMKRVSGDAFAEIVWDDPKERNFAINIVPLNPKNIKIIVNEFGQVVRYEQWIGAQHGKIITAIKKLLGKNPVRKIDVKDMFHLCHNRLGDQIHGISDIDVVESTILAQEKNFTYAERAAELSSHPFFVFKLKSDNETKLAITQENIKNAINQGTFAIFPDDDNSLTIEPPVQINPGSTVFEFENLARNRFFRATGTPQVLAGNSSGSEAGTKMEYFANEQIWEKDQTYLEKQILNQLYLKINFNPPATMQAALQTDESKDGSAHMLNMQPNDTTAGVGR